MADLKSDYFSNPVQVRPEDYRLVPFLSEADGTQSMNVDGSTPVRFSSIYPSIMNDPFLVTGITIVMEDDAVLEPDAFGNIGVLTNGLDFHWEDASGNKGPSLSPGPIQINADFSLIANAGSVSTATSGPTESLLTVKMAFLAAGIQIILFPGERFVWTVQDDLSGAGLVNLRSVIYGYVRRR